VTGPKKPARAPTFDSVFAAGDIRALSDSLSLIAASVKSRRSIDRHDRQVIRLGKVADAITDALGEISDDVRR
jgi:hypothetical protein